MPVRVVEGVVQHYEWGDPTFIPNLLGVAGKGKPWAELWLGTHPNGPTLLDNGEPLSELTGELTYLLKVLSAAEPLSLQAHPTPEQAADGFEQGVFGDAYPKPELLVALTEFEALCGVRPDDATVDLLRRIGADRLADTVAADGAGAAMRALYLGEIDPTDTIAVCADADGPEAAWVRTLAERYPGDPSVVVTLLLNHVTLQPGEAIHLTAGNLHAYLRGSGIELMRASDNVVRGGLTVKEVDIDLLLDVVDPTPLAQPVMEVTDGRYPLPEAGVALLKLEAGDSHTAVGHELAVTIDGTTLYFSPGTPVYAETTTFVVTTL
ncbi:mannose-6-phosphate isomerase, class I [Ilumatobacter coccineus]|uniref:mannose-6-phosphate isomerase n=1 Tax=Ilumatobacter coccineus (strain NBRC 103263 / KCTC 29153 / YM16-304) TaxID=1313172 RepID=A0A6C7ED48_ILUCY|nr:mannose-6-phosphate isomerase, class I [Ilumatobacter coccineus]BAN03055.1 mannose-6-phosphate isomerase [Ilumatobacter coccineus YM16-304]